MSYGEGILTGYIWFGLLGGVILVFCLDVARAKIGFRFGRRHFSGWARRDTYVGAGRRVCTRW